MASKQTIPHDQAVLEKYFEEFCQDLYSSGFQATKDKGDEFERFCMDCLYKGEGLSSNQVSQAIIGGERDGGIDAVMLWVDDRPIFDIEEANELVENYDKVSKKGWRTKTIVHVDLVQAKLGKVTSSEVPAKIEFTVRNFFGNSKGSSNVKYSPDLVERLGFVKQVIDLLAVRSSGISFTVKLCAGVAGELNGHAREIAKDIEKSIKEEYSSSRVNYEVFGPSELTEKASFEGDCNSEIVTDKAFSVGSQYLFIVPIENYYNTITDEGGRIRDQLFDGNIRAFLGSRLENNSGIAKSLEDYGSSSKSTVPFWWKNNGITITCSKEPQKTGDKYSLTDAQIVNGLQTSYTIYNYLKDNPERLERSATSASNCVFVKVISSDDENTRDEIISATNSQTPIDSASLRSTDLIHRQIERFFDKDKSNDSLVYDRRKGSASFRNVPSHKVIQITSLSQVVLSMCLFQPDTARARPGNATKDDTLYGKVFGNKKISLDTYLNAAKVYNRVENYLSSGGRQKADVNNCIWYVLTLISVIVSGVGKDDLLVRNNGRGKNKVRGKRDSKNARELILKSVTFGVPPVVLEDQDIDLIFNVVLQVLKEFADENKVDLAKAAKGAQFKLLLLERFFDNRTSVAKLKYAVSFS